MNDKLQCLKLNASWNVYFKFRKIFEIFDEYCYPIHLLYRVLLTIHRHVYIYVCVCVYVCSHSAINCSASIRTLSGVQERVATGSVLSLRRLKRFVL